MKNIKTKINKRKLELTVIFLALIVIILLKIITIPIVSAEDNSSIPSLFLNDTHFVYSMPGSNIYLPLEKVDGVYYIPLSILKYFGGITIESNDKYDDTFMMSYNTKWMSFKFSTETAQIGVNKYIPCKVLHLNYDLYVPAQIIADNLGLFWDVREVRPGYNVGRISTKNVRLTFDELLNKFLPKPQPTTTPPTEPPSPPPPPPITEPPPIETTTPDPVDTVDPVIEPDTTKPINVYVPPKPTEPPTTTEPTTAENTREIQNYLMFYDSSESYDNYINNADDENNESPDSENNSENENAAIIDKPNKISDRITEVLKLLDKNKMRAIFFLSGSEITENPDILRTIYVSGHELGIKFESGKINVDAEDLISELEAVNDLIYSAVKHKTRFCIFDENLILFPDYNSDSDNIEDSVNSKELYEKKFIERGYYLCSKTIDIFDLGDITDLNEMINFMKQKRVNVFMFDLNGSYRNYLELSAKAADSKFYINFSYINNANIELIKRQTNR